MDYMEKITGLRAEKAELNTQAQALVEEGKLEEAGALADRMAGINAQLQTLEKLLDESRKNAAPAGGGYDGVLHAPPAGDGAPNAREQPFASLGEQLRAIYAFRKHHVEDGRLQRVNNAVLGVNEGAGADGGFALQTDFAGMILESAVQQSPLLNRLDRYTCSSPANAMRWVSADETDVSASVFGGVQMYWAAEGAAVAASRPRFKEIGRAHV